MNLQEIQTILSQYVLDIQALGMQIEEKRIEMTVARANLSDAMTRVRDEIFTKQIEVKASEMGHYVHWKTAKEEKEFDRLRDEVVVFEQKKSILVEVNNTLKLQARLQMHEMENLPFS